MEIRNLIHSNLYKNNIERLTSQQATALQILVSGDLLVYICYHL